MNYDKQTIYYTRPFHKCKRHMQRLIKDFVAQLINVAKRFLRKSNFPVTLKISSSGKLVNHTLAAGKSCEGTCRSFVLGDHSYAK